MEEVRNEIDSSNCSEEDRDKKPDEYGCEISISDFIFDYSRNTRQRKEREREREWL